MREAAERFGVCERTIRRRISDGTITAYRIGPRILRVDLDEVEKAFIIPIPTVNRD
jgi:excisionase family DNA binding protein